MSNNKMRFFHSVSRRQNLVALFIIFGFIFLGASSIRGKASWTVDERSHLLYGANILNGDSTRFDDSKMPVSAWNALPAKIGSYWPDGAIKAYLGRMITARWMTVLFSAIVAFVVFYWSRQLYGFAAGIVSLVLYVLDPNVIAHSQLVTTDIYVTGIILFCCYWLWKFSNHPNWKNGLTLAVMLGLAQLTKYTAFSLYFLFPIVLLASELPRLGKEYKKGIKRQVWQEAGMYVKVAVVTIVVGIVIINIGFLFNRTFTPLKDYQFKSGLFQSVQTDLSFMGGIPVPTPYPYLEGLDWITAKEHAYAGRFYMLGMTRDGKGFPGYYFVASFLKVPIATQIILTIAGIFYFVKKRASFWKNEAFLLWLVLFYTIYFNFLYNVQIGIRHYLIVFPLLYVFAGSLFQGWQGFSRAQKAFSFALAIYLFSSVLSYYPNYIPYFNEIVWDRKRAYKYLADSNLDWGQDDYIFEQYHAAHRDVVKVPEVPCPIKKTTTYFMPVNQLVGVKVDSSLYAWVRENFEPVDMIAPSYLLYTFTPEQIQTLCDTTDYCK